MEEFEFFMMDDTIDLSDILNNIEKENNYIIPSEDLKFIIGLLGLKEEDSD